MKGPQSVCAFDVAHSPSVFQKALSSVCSCASAGMEYSASYYQYDRAINAKPWLLTLEKTTCNKQAYVPISLDCGKKR